MQQRVYSCLALRTFLKLRTCAEGLFASEWTCWKPCSKTHETFRDDQSIRRFQDDKPICFC